MARFLLLIGLAFKIWLLFDAAKKRVESYWYFIIFFIPFGDVAYFIIVKSADYNFKSIFRRRVTLSRVRHEFESSPSRENRIRLAKCLFDENKSEEALHHFNVILEQYPQDTDALFGAGLASFELKKYEEAAEALRNLIELHPGYRDYTAWLELSKVLWQSDRKDECLKTLRELVKYNPRIDHQVLLTQCLVQLDNRDEARKLIDTALEEFRHSPAYVKRNYYTFATKLKHLRSEL